ncbi:MAG TPA: hypothetical protein VLK65_11285 [Vicinamibacteria bacterium]|nr:hypothetical protein [Vicinamibacteria bacterium]
MLNWMVEDARGSEASSDRRQRELPAGSDDRYPRRVNRRVEPSWFLDSTERRLYLRSLLATLE